MLITRRPSFALGESQATPETVYRDFRPIRRRQLVLGAGAGLLAGRAFGAPAPVPSTRYPPGRAITPESAATGYNNFYEFSEDKDVVAAAQKLQISPWSIAIKGLVRKERTIGIEDLLRAMPIEQRVLRHRCVEGWAMTVPWTGFPLARLVAFADPLASAKYVAFTSALQPDNMPGTSVPIFPWPFTEGLAIDEATNDLAFMATGMYGGQLPKQDGAPIRLLVPWKYGFKSAKSIVTVEFVSDQPTTFWSQLNPDYYGFWANVNPLVPNPAHSQSHEILLGSNETVPTQLYNGYASSVASLYANRKGDNLFR